MLDSGLGRRRDGISYRFKTALYHCVQSKGHSQTPFINYLVQFQAEFSVSQAVGTVDVE